MTHPDLKRQNILTIYGYNICFQVLDLTVLNPKDHNWNILCYGHLPNVYTYKENASRPM